MKLIIRSLSALFIGVISAIAMGCPAAPSAKSGAEEASVNDAFGIPGIPQLIVETFNGRVEITGGGTTGAIRVAAELRHPERVNYRTAQEGDVVRVTAEEVKRRWGWLPWRWQDGGAHIHVTVPRQADVKARSSNGTITLRDIAGTGELRTSNGNITVKEVDGQFNLKTSNGGITVLEADGQFDLKTSNGGIRFQGGLEPRSDNTFKTSNGNITAALSGEPPNVRVKADTSNGGIRLDKAITVDGNMSKNHITGVMGDGSANLTLKTSNGSITIE